MIALQENEITEKPFYKVLESLERRSGFTERDAIQRLGIPRSTYRSWKDGTCEPSKRRYWQLLAEVFGLDVSELIY